MERSAAQSVRYVLSMPRIVALFVFARDSESLNLNAAGEVRRYFLSMVMPFGPRLICTPLGWRLSSYTL